MGRKVFKSENIRRREEFGLKRPGMVQTAGKIKAASHGSFPHSGRYRAADRAGLRANAGVDTELWLQKTPQQKADDGLREKFSKEIAIVEENTGSRHQDVYRSMGQCAQWRCGQDLRFQGSASKPKTSASKTTIRQSRKSKPAPTQTETLMSWMWCVQNARLD